MTALEDVAAERRRQVEVEGRTQEGDDAYLSGQLARAAACYALNAGQAGAQLMPRTSHGIPLAWPWADAWWKPSNARRDLVKAAALIVAEIDRIDRSQADD